VITLALTATTTAVGDPEKITTSNLDYQCGTQTCKGYIAYPATIEAVPASPCAAVIIVHDSWGLNDFIKRKTEQIAERPGYIGFAVDLYGNGTITTSADDSKLFSTKLTSSVDALFEQLRAGLNELLRNPRIDPKRIAAIGYGFGGFAVLNAARAGEKDFPFKMIASYYGVLSPPPDIRYEFPHPYMAIFVGDKDEFVPPSQLAEFRKEMAFQSLKGEISVYQNTAHGFSDPEATRQGEELKLPIRYHNESDESSWARLIELLIHYLGPNQQ